MNGTMNVQTYVPNRADSVRSAKGSQKIQSSSDSPRDSFRDMISQAGEENTPAREEGAPVRNEDGKTQPQGEGEEKREQLPGAGENAKEAAVGAAQMAVQTVKETVFSDTALLGSRMAGETAESAQAQTPAIAAQTVESLEEAPALAGKMTAAEPAKDLKHAAGELLRESRMDLRASQKSPGLETAQFQPSSAGELKGTAVPAGQTGDAQQTAVVSQAESQEIVSPHSTETGPAAQETEFSYKTQGNEENTKSPEVQAQLVTGREALSKSSLGQTVQIKVAEPYYSWNPEFSGKLSSNILKNLSMGVNEFEIQLEPEHLGKILVKVSFTEEGAKVMLSCTNEKTMGLLTENAKSIGTIVENNTGNATVVEVKQEQNGYWNQQRDAADQGSGRGSDRQDGRKKSEQDEREDFIQQLRLGLLGTPDTSGYDALLG